MSDTRGKVGPAAGAAGICRMRSMAKGYIKENQRLSSCGIGESYSRILRDEDAVELLDRHRVVPFDIGALGYKESVAGGEGLGTEIGIGEGDRALQQMHQFVARKRHRLAA